ncbi:GntR family transcriptional regulator [Acidocella sp.]|uniref:GntR family transcriptional regulator n=1 Tax=Acidocella sp. TaxID=50710 RepID=UPI002615515A|nr:GntR family transcriptional regulator [Acidocella sp.]
MDDMPAPPRENLSEGTYQVLKAALMRGRFRPGERLKIRDLAAEFCTSVTPVRDALWRLVQDDGLEFRSARDIRVPALSRADYLEIRAMRVALEGLAARQAATQASAADLDGLALLLTRHEAALAEGEHLDALSANQEFHLALAVCAGMPILAATLERLWLRMGPLIAQNFGARERGMIEHHYPVLDALRARDGDAAAMAIARDIVEGGKGLLDFLTGAEAQTHD